MKVLFVTALIAFLGAVSVFSQTENAPLAGFWEGAVEKDGKSWRVNINIEKTGESYRALADFIDADGYAREFTVRQTNDAFRLERPQPGSAPIVFEGAPGGDVFAGSWSGFGQTATFRLTRGKLPPKFFAEREVSFKSGDVTLAGTLILPLKGGTFPAVVITHGGSPQNERSFYKSWARHFARAGIAALIYDKRGAGKSTGETRAASMEDLARDAVAGVELLKLQPEIEKTRIGVAGHSQGGWVAPLASVMSRDVRFVIASAAAGVGPDRQSIYHRANVMRESGFSEETVRIAADLRARLYETGRMLLAGDARAAEERRKISRELERYRDAPWLDAAALPPNLENDNPTRGGLQLLFFDPVPMWERVKVPVLLVWGDRDSVVPVAEGRQIIENALRKSGNRNVTTRIFPNVNHAVVLVGQDKTWDFPRVALNYYAAISEWTRNQTK